MFKLPKTITEKEFLETIKKVKKNKIKLAFLLGFYECMRISEVIKLKIDDIDKERGFIHIKQSKGKKDRYIPLNPLISKGIKNLPINISRQALHKQIKKYFPDLHFHSLRHSGATYYLNKKGIGLRQLQQFLGHSRIATTQIYTHITPDDLKKEFEKIW